MCECIYLYMSVGLCFYVGLCVMFRGIHPLWGNAAFQINFLNSSKNFPFLPFPKKFPIFIRQNFWWPLFSHRLQIWNVPLFSLFQYISPISEKLLFARIPLQISPWFRNIYAFLHTFSVLRFPPTLTLMHLCITQCTYWTPLVIKNVSIYTTILRL